MVALEFQGWQGRYQLKGGRFIGVAVSFTLAFVEQFSLLAWMKLFVGYQSSLRGAFG